VRRSSADRQTSCVSNFRIRAPRTGEAKSIADLHLRTWIETYAGIFSPSALGEQARADKVAMWASICEAPRPDFQAAVVEVDGELVGFAGAGRNVDEPPPRPRQLWFIYLLAHAQGSGAGQALLEEVLGDNPASLWVLERNSRARSFYRRNGFIEDGTAQATGYANSGNEIRMVR
jgi:GNAT superfamily N-acetyltransferase